MDPKEKTNPEEYAKNLETSTLNNTYYRNVVYTLPNLQLVLMNIKPNSGIDKEVHPNTTQFIRIESGRGAAIVGKNKYNLRDGATVIVPPGVEHEIINTSDTDDLKLYTIYTPPEHKPNLEQSLK